MVDEQAVGATPDGAVAPSQAPVAEGTAVDLEKIDLHTIPNFRKYDAEMQRKVAEATRRANEAEARAQEAQLATMQENLRAQGLDEQAIKKNTQPMVAQLVTLQRDNILLRLGMQMEDIEPGDYGNSPTDLERNLTRKKKLRDEERALEERRRELAELEKQTMAKAKDEERESRKASGADRQVPVTSEPSPGLEAEWKAEVKAARAKGGDVALINRKYRKKGLAI
jgi:Skp family chaperone for outer membrane proteins